MFLLKIEGLRVRPPANLIKEKELYFSRLKVTTKATQTFFEGAADNLHLLSNLIGHLNYRACLQMVETYETLELPPVTDNREPALPNAQEHLLQLRFRLAGRRLGILEHQLAEYLTAVSSDANPPFLTECID